MRCTGGNTGGELSAQDLELLCAWLNPAYLKPEAWAKVTAAMEADGSVQLQKFLRADVAAAIAAAARRQDAAEGVGGGSIPDFRAGYGAGACLDVLGCCSRLQQALVCQFNG
jgi:hypothetical protein